MDCRSLVLETHFISRKTKKGDHSMGKCTSLLLGEYQKSVFYINTRDTYQLIYIYMHIRIYIYIESCGIRSEQKAMYILGNGEQQTGNRSTENQIPGYQKLVEGNVLRSPAV